MGDGWLGEAHEVGQIAYASLAVGGGGNQLEQSDACGIAERLERSREPLGRLDVEDAARHARAAAVCASINGS